MSFLSTNVTQQGVKKVCFYIDSIESKKKTERNETLSRVIFLDNSLWERRRNARMNQMASHRVSAHINFNRVRFHLSIKWHSIFPLLLHPFNP